MKIPGIGQILAERAGSQEVIEKAGREIEYCRKQGIDIYDLDDPRYPKRLKECEDAPLILFYRGKMVLESSRALSIVGTRRASAYGIECAEKLIRDLAVYYPETLIISGLAYGIDYTAHSMALREGLPTVAVLGHGLHTIYPAEHRNMAQRILEYGGLATDFDHLQRPERNNFIKRNRIIAGLSNATIVVESGKTGGALITADIAASYNRDVFAFPGRVGDRKSAGCNDYIKRNKAALIEDIEDLEYFLGWERDRGGKPARQKVLFSDYTDLQKQILKTLKDGEVLNSDSISLLTDMPVSRVSAELLKLEFEGQVRVLPGGQYKRV